MPSVIKRSASRLEQKPAAAILFAIRSLSFVFGATEDGLAFCKVFEFLSLSFDSNGKLCTIQNFSGHAYGCEKPIELMEAEDGKVTFLHFNRYADAFGKEDEIQLL